MGLVFDEELDVEDIHYQMVKLHQNLKQIQMQKEQWIFYFLYDRINDHDVLRVNFNFKNKKLFLSMLPTFKLYFLIFFLRFWHLDWMKLKINKKLKLKKLSVVGYKQNQNRRNSDYEIVVKISIGRIFG